MYELRIAIDLDAHVSRSHFPLNEKRSKIENLNEIEKIQQTLTLTNVALEHICIIVVPENPKQVQNCVIAEITAETGNADRKSALALTKAIAGAASTLD